MSTQQLYLNGKSTRLREWLRIISLAGSAQILVQASSFIGGIFILRMLSTHEYALYTIANAVLGTMAVLNDGGVTTGAMSEGAKAWQDKGRMGSVLNTALLLRRKFAIASLIIVIPVLFYMLRSHDASWTLSCLITLSLIPAFFAAISGSLLEIVPKLSQEIAPLQKLQVQNNIGRLVLLCIGLFAMPWAFIAILASGIPQIWMNMKLRFLASGYADLSAKADKQIKASILKIVYRVMPASIYYCLSGQITIWLSSVYGSTSTVAQLGALGRIAMLFNLFMVLFGALIMPRFARLPVNKHLLLRRFSQVMMLLFALCVVIMVSAWMFSAQILWVLGPQYAGLNSEVVLSVLASCIGMVAGSAFTLYSNRGWTINPALLIAISLCTIGLGVLLIDISTIRGMISLQLFIVSSEALMHSGYCILRIKKISG
ncbi:lipopolysaccharide biosynthesis protein [Arcticibacter sp.]|uniref:lipopolysaccharide biosynthesis protein n=1 Tax=Arcticibacter sp. TaxID=1872630 RepID=UPI00388FBD38